MTAGTIFFAVCSIIALVGGVATVAARSPIRCAVGLLATIMGIAGLFLKLNAQFMAAIQLIVYAGAVVVLFVFVIMLLGPDASDSATGHPPQARISRAIAGGLLALLAVGALLLLIGAGGEPTRFGRVGPEHGSVEAVGGLIFTRGLVPFELATALLIVSVVGAIAVARSRHVAKPLKQGANPTKRLFHGPIHPRDAGRPLPKEGLL